MINGIVDNQNFYKREKWIDGILVNVISVEALWDVRAAKCVRNICPIKEKFVNDLIDNEEDMLVPWGIYPTRTGYDYYRKGDSFGNPQKSLTQEWISRIKF